MRSGPRGANPSAPAWRNSWARPEHKGEKSTREENTRRGAGGTEGPEETRNRSRGAVRGGEGLYVTLAPGRGRGCWFLETGEGGLGAAGGQ